MEEESNISNNTRRRSSNDTNPPTSNPSQPSGRCLIHHFPNELILQILCAAEPFSSSPPSTINIYKEPSISLVSQPNKHPLKDFSTVCKRWRRLLLPTLFQYSCVHLPPQPRWLEISEGVLQYLSRSGRTQHEERIFEAIMGEIRARCDPRVSTRSSSASPPPISSPASTPVQHVEFGAAVIDARNNTPSSQRPIAILEYAEDSDAILLGSKGPPKYFWRWVPSLNGTLQQYLDFITTSEIAGYVKSFVLLTDEALDRDRLTGAEEALLQREVRKLWRAVFSAFGGGKGLGRVVVAAPPSTMAALTDSREGPADTWAFKMPLHYAEFALDLTHPTKIPTSAPSSFKPDNSSSSRPSSSPPPQPPHHPFTLYNAQPWLRLHYNEGAFVAAYSHYEWHWKKPPQILYHLLCWLAKASRCHTCAVRPALRELTYTSLFPFAAHVRALAARVHDLPDINVLRVRMASPELLEDRGRMGTALAEDCWSEWRAAYVAVARVVVVPALKGFLFESLDDAQEGTRAEVEKVFEGQKVVEAGIVKAEGDGLRWVKGGTG